MLGTAADVEAPRDLVANISVILAHLEASLKIYYLFCLQHKKQMAEEEGVVANKRYDWASPVSVKKIYQWATICALMAGRRPISFNSYINNLSYIR